MCLVWFIADCFTHIPCGYFTGTDEYYLIVDEAPWRMLFNGRYANNWYHGAHISWYKV